MHHRNQKEAITRIRNTGKHIVPRQERGHNAEAAACTGQSDVGLAFGVVLRVEVGDTEHQVSEPDGQEEG